MNALYQEWNVAVIGFCGKYRSECNVDMCDLLKPITDYVLEERVAENITKRIPLADIGE
mgnify:FL=1